MCEKGQNASNMCIKSDKIYSNFIKRGKSRTFGLMFYLFKKICKTCESNEMFKKYLKKYQTALVLFEKLTKYTFCTAENMLVTNKY